MKRGNIAFFIPHRGCPHQCSFCDQRAISGEQETVTPEMVGNELREAFAQPQDSASEIAFFGGSFTCLPEREMTAFLEAAAPYVRSGQAAGIRCSTRPDGINKTNLAILRAYGAASVELGAQSMNDQVLLRNRRGHTAEDVANASALIREAGLSLGLQMMVGLPGEGPEGAMETARAFLSLKPDTVRIYPALVVRGTLLEQWYQKGEYRPLSLEEAVARCAPLLPLFEQNGVRVIRVGLHPSPSLEAGLVAGPYHPAFRELCESRLFREAVKKATWQYPKGSALVLLISPRDRSIAVGQKRENLLYWESLGYSLQIREDSGFSRGKWKLMKAEK